VSFAVTCDCVAVAVGSGPLQLPLALPVLCAMTNVAASMVLATALMAALPTSFFSLFILPFLLWTGKRGALGRCGSTRIHNFFILSPAQILCSVFSCGPPTEKY